MLLPRGMLGRDVELGEVEIVGLDVGPFGDGEAHVAEDLGHLVPHLADRMDAPVLQRPEPHGQRHVGLLGGETRRERAALQVGLARLQRLADARLEPVDGLAERLALVGRQRAELRHQLGHAALLAQRGDAHALDARRGRRPRRSRRGARLRARRCRWFRSSCRYPRVRSVIPGRDAQVHARSSRDPARSSNCSVRLAARWVPDTRCATSGMTVTPPFSLAAAWSTSALKPAASLTARSASTLRSISMPALRQAVDKSAVGEAVLAHGRVDALDPERAEGALLALAVAIGVLHRLLDRLLGDADRILAAAVIALGLLQDFLVLGVGGDAALDACHGSNSVRLEDECWSSDSAVQRA